jgi:hypothetical protein
LREKNIELKKAITARASSQMISILENETRSLDSQINSMNQQALTLVQRLPTPPQPNTNILGSELNLCNLRVFFMQKLLF